MIQVGCDQPTSKLAIEMAEKYESMWATVGLHPTDVKDVSDMETEIRWMKDLLEKSKKVVAIGETGIDYYHEPYDALAQQEAFRMQCELAKEYGLPVIVHLRNTKRPVDGRAELNEAEQDCLNVLDQVEMPEGKVIFHCFSGGTKMAQDIIARGWLLSFSGVVTYPGSAELREIAAMVPDGQFVVETDCPFLPPQKYRGERNEPSYVLETARVVAEARGVSLDEVERLTDANGKQVFGV